MLRFARNDAEAAVLFAAPYRFCYITRTMMMKTNIASVFFLSR